MKWFKFVIWVQCFLGGIGDIASGIMQMTGATYDGKADLVYTFYPSLKTADMVYGIFCIAIGALLIYTRFGIKKFKWQPTNIYLFLPLAIALSSIAYYVAAGAILDVSLTEPGFITSSSIGSVVGSIGLTVANFIYFNKRKHLFDQ